MAAARVASKESVKSPPKGLRRGIGPRETALYTRDLLRSLIEIAVQQEQFRLAELLKVAGAEANRLSKAK